MNLYYLTLVRSLSGYCVKFLAPSEDVVRAHATLYYGRLWCSIYRDRPTETCINEYPIILEEAEYD